MFSSFARFFSQDKYWDNRQIREFSRQLVTILDRDQLLYSILTAMIQFLHLQGGSIFIWNESKKHYELKFAQGNSKPLVESFPLDNVIVGYIKKGEEEIILDERKKDGKLSWVQIELKKEFNRLNCCLAVSLVFRKKLLGILFFGEKKSCKPYTAQDLDLLLMLAGESAIALDNAELFSHLQMEKEKMETIFYGMSDGVILTDLNFKVLTLNPAAKFLLGISESSLGQDLKKELREFDFSTTFDEIIAEKNKNSFRYTIERKQPQLLILDCTTTRIFSAGNISAGFVTLFRDITAEKKEEGIKQSFIALISHKLRTPLVPLLGYAPLLLEGEENEKLSPFQRKAIQAIAKQSKLMVELVEKLISFTFLENPHSVSKFDWCNLNLLAGDVLNKLEYVFLKQSVEFSIDQSVAEAPLVYVDKTRVKEILIILIENAVKFNPKENKIVKITAASYNEQFVQVGVADNGNGIPREEWETIFLKFYQVEKKFTGQVEGMGLGLYVAKMFIESLGGKIWVESTSGEGSSFFFLLPIKQKTVSLPQNTLKLDSL